MDLPPPPPPPSQSFFGSPRQSNTTGQDTITQVNSLGRRMRMLEETVSNLRRKAELDEQNNLKAEKKSSDNVLGLTADIDSIGHQLKSFKDDMIKIIRELQNTAKKEDVATLEKYINLWQPIQFVTQKEVQRIVEYEIEKQLKNVKLPTQVVEEDDDNETITLSKNALQDDEEDEDADAPQKPAQNEASFEKPLFSREEAPQSDEESENDSEQSNQKEDPNQADTTKPDLPTSNTTAHLSTDDLLRNFAQKIQQTSSQDVKNKDKKDLHELL